ncbi:MAG: c-type cytochrome [Bacteroidota bacterium]
MNSAFKKYFFLVLLASPWLFNACQQPDGDSPGSEYMPDMGHSIAYEANHYDYYYYNTWGSEEEYYKMAKPRKPINGTVPRGYAAVHFAKGPRARAVAMSHHDGTYSSQTLRIPINGSVPYNYDDTEAERTRASNEILDNPFPITADGLERGKDLYNKFCGVCHGEKGDGNGWLVDEKNLNAAYPAAPANFLLDTFYNSTNGRYYHALIYGKNVMGGYSDKISYEERWQVIHWIHALQAKEKKLEYTEEINTLNSVDIPGKVWDMMAANELKQLKAHDSGAHQGGGSHGDDHSGSGHGSDHGGHGDGHDHGDGHHSEGHHGGGGK